jgi:hypothetical protein
MSVRADELPFSLGTTQVYTAGDDLTAILGREYMITDNARFIPDGGRAPTDLKKRVRLVRNVSGIVLLPKRAVKFKSGTNMTEIDGYCNVGDEQVAGIVDEFIPVSVADTELFFITIEGPTLFVTEPGTTTNAFSIGDRLSAVTAAASTHSTTSGRIGKSTMVAPTNVASAGTFAAQVQNFVVTALSACTSGQTNTDRLGVVSYHY